jgi:hypothetical protein
LAKVSLKGSGVAFASAPEVVPESAVDVDVAVLVVVEVGGASVVGAGGASAMGAGGASAMGAGGASPMGAGGASPMGAGGASPMGAGGASAFGFGGASGFAVDAPTGVDVDVAAPSRVRMAIAVCEEHASKHNASPALKAGKNRATVLLAFKATGVGTTLSFNTSAVARLRLESSSAVAPNSATREN